MITKKVFLYFPKCETEKPIVYHLVKDYSLEVNIFRAKVTSDEQGFLLLDVTGEEENIEKAMAWVKTFDVTVNETNKGLLWSKESCASCGVCIPHCRTHALHFENQRTRKVGFDSDKCIGCLCCVDICPFKACASLF